MPASELDNALSSFTPRQSCEVKPDVGTLEEGGWGWSVRIELGFQALPS